MNRFGRRRGIARVFFPGRRREGLLCFPRLFLGLTLFASTLAVPAGAVAAATAVEAENVGKTFPGSATTRETFSSHDDGFDCQGDRGGLLYQVIWKKNKNSSNTFELKQYDVDKAEYTVAASYESKDVTGDADG
ncbi:MAG: hypothetical protein VX833_06370, partial [Actinomycetota bacterium]|nr:hypothetical protein [Actinomycetota bacterium]